MRFVIADAAGAILQQCATGMSLEDVLATWDLSGGRQAVLVAEWVQDQTHWRVVDGAVVERAAMAPAVSAAAIAADGVAEAVISGLPDPCTVQVTGPAPVGPLEVTGGSLTLTATLPGAYRVRVSADPTHKPWDVTIHAS